MSSTVRLLIPLAAAVAAYASGLGGDFIFDDIHHIVDNPGLRHPGDFGAALSSGFQETRPVFMASLALNYWAHGPSPLGFHLVNLALHLVCVALVFGLASRFRGPSWFPLIAALLFAVHPAGTEAVTYINSRSGLLAAAFGLGGMLVFVRGRSVSRTMATIALFALAIGSKESAVVFPVLTFAWLLLVEKDRRARDAIPLVVAVAVLPLLFLLADNPHRGTIGAGTIPLWSHLLTQTRVLIYFVGLALLPLEQNIDYDFAVSTGFDLSVGLSLAGLLALFVIVLAVRRGAPIVTLGIVWFFIAVAPTNSLVPFKDFIAERHLYLPLVGFALALGWLAAAALQRMPPTSRWVGMVAIGVYIVGLTVTAAQRNRVLAEPMTLWQVTAASSPNKARPHVNLGILLIKDGDLERGAAHLLHAAELDPSDVRAHYNAAAAAERLGRFDLATEHFRAAHELSPAPRFKKAYARSLARLGGVQFKRGQLAAASKTVAQSIELEPEQARHHFNAAVIARALGNADAALAEIERVLVLAPSHRGALRMRAELSAASTNPPPTNPPPTNPPPDEVPPTTP